MGIDAVRSTTMHAPCKKFSFGRQCAQGVLKRPFLQRIAVGMNVETDNPRL